MNKLTFENYLLVLKSTVEVYVHGTLESSNKDVKNLLKNSLNIILDMQEETYNQMSKCGWYQINNIDSNTINQTLIKIKNN